MNKRDSFNISSPVLTICLFKSQGYFEKQKFLLIYFIFISSSVISFVGVYYQFSFLYWKDFLILYVLSSFIESIVIPVSSLQIKDFFVSHISGI